MPGPDRPEHEPIPDRSPAAWLVEQLRVSSGPPLVGDWMPEGFERYARFPDAGILPAWPDSRGSLVADLAPILAGFTRTPETSWYCVWVGYGGMQRHKRRAIDITRRMNEGLRRYVLFRVTVEGPLLCVSPLAPLRLSWWRIRGTGHTSSVGSSSHGPRSSRCGTARTSGGPRIEPGSCPPKWMLIPPIWENRRASSTGWSPTLGSRPSPPDWRTGSISPFLGGRGNFRQNRPIWRAPGGHRGCRPGCLPPGTGPRRPSP
jgi:hypothetical protein